MELIMEQEHSTPELERFRMKALDVKQPEQQQ